MQMKNNAEGTSLRGPGNTNIMIIHGAFISPGEDMYREGWLVCKGLQ